MVEEEHFGRDFSHLVSIENYHSLNPSISWFQSAKLGLKPETNLHLVLKDLQELQSFFIQLFDFFKIHGSFSDFRTFEGEFSIVFSRFLFFKEHFSKHFGILENHHLNIVGRCLQTIFMLSNESNQNGSVYFGDDYTLVLLNLEVVLRRLNKVIAAFQLIVLNSRLGSK